MEESSGAWLHRMLVSVCSGEIAMGIQLDPETISSLVSYCELASPADAVEYLVNIVGDEACVEIADEYVKRRTSPPSTMKTETGTSMHAYQKKSQVDSYWESGNKNPKASKQQQQQKPNGGGGEPSSSSTSSAAPATAPASTTPGASSKPRKARAKKAPKALTIAEATKMMEFPQGKPCDCQATRHQLVNNCLSCGKIICQQEGEGPCNFCGALVLKDGSTYAGLEGATLTEPADESEAAAQAFRDRLVEYDRNSASRTTVIDDQSDFFEADGDAWMSEEEKLLLRKKQQEYERAEEERRKRVIVTIDLLGRKVVMAGGAEDASNESILLGSTTSQAATRDESLRVKASPDARELPVYVNTGPARKKTGDDQSRSMGITGRVQYDDSFAAALLGRKLELLQIDQPGDWEQQEPKLMPNSSSFEEAAQGFECA